MSPDFPFRLDSGPGFGRMGRYSFSGDRPFAVLQARGDEILFETENGTEQWRGDPFEALEVALDRNACPARRRGAPLSAGGMVGYLGYGLRRWVEQTPARRVAAPDIPDMWFGCYRPIRRVRHNPVYRSPVSGRGDDRDRVSASAFHADSTRSDYLDAVRRIRDYIFAGDVYQVNLAQRFSASWPYDGLTLYQRLNAINPAPFAAYLDCGAFQIVSVSPERFLHYNPLTRRVETRPIKGTRPRGATPEEDRNMAERLLESAKDRAEHIMIVDLERNDLGRVCDTGTVRVDELFTLEEHPTVWHIVSTVSGRLKERSTRIDLLRASFPGGSITGAPKIRAMEIIDELEPVERGVYTGAIGYLGFDGSMDLNIAIRTLTLKDGLAYFHAGGGVVADSDPSAEYAETLDKAAAMFRVLAQDQS